MKIALVTLGTRGDTQPFVALGKALATRGHHVVLGAPENFRNWIEGLGLTYRSIGVDMQAFARSRDGRRVIGGNPLAMARIWRKEIVPLTRRSLNAIWEAARDADVIVHHPKTAGAVDVGEATGAVVIHAAPFPVFPTRAFPLFVFPGNYGPWLNRCSYRALQVSRLLFSQTVNDWRKETLGLGKAPFYVRSETGQRASLQLCAVSPAVLPDYPADPCENIETTGYWFLDEGHHWRPSPELAHFLEDGDPPIYVGLGSMTPLDPAALTSVIVEGLRRSGARAVVAAGWGGLGDVNLPSTVHAITEAPHDALFAHVSAVVHHGGAGTTAAGLRAGLPTLVCPLTVDQPFWGRRVEALGCGPKPLSLKRLRSSRLAEGLAQLTERESYRTRAREVAQAISREDGTRRAVEVIEAAAM